MSSIAAETLSQCSAFFARLASASHRVVFVDYDGTLAPFVTDRRHAPPYPGLMDLLAEVRAGNTRVVAVSGRRAREVIELMGVNPPFEVWGSHGFERILPDGEYRTGHIDDALEKALARAHEDLTFQGLNGRVERKACGIAVHWRGLPPEHAREIAAVAERTLKRLANSQVSLSKFDGGLEARLRGYDKGYVVRTVMAESPVGTIAAFLGDDLTDEDGFRAVQAHGAGILVRPEYRATAANFWLRPPADVADFFHEWCALAGGAR